MARTIAPYPWAWKRGDEDKSGPLLHVLGEPLQGESLGRVIYFRTPKGAMKGIPKVHFSRHGQVSDRPRGRLRSKDLPMHRLQAAESQACGGSGQLDLEFRDPVGLLLGDEDHAGGVDDDPAGSFQ